jgi:hypothetical protein
MWYLSVFIADYIQIVYVECKYKNHAKSVAHSRINAIEHTTQHKQCDKDSIHGNCMRNKPETKGFFYQKPDSINLIELVWIGYANWDNIW